MFPNMDVELVSPDDRTDNPSGDDDRSAAGVGILGAGDVRLSLRTEYACVGYVLVESVGYELVMECASSE